MLKDVNSKTNLIEMVECEEVKDDNNQYLNQNKLDVTTSMKNSSQNSFEINAVMSGLTDDIDLIPLMPISENGSVAKYNSKYISNQKLIYI